MSRSHRHSIFMVLRIAALTAVFVGPVGAFAYANAGDKGPGMTGAGFVLYVSLQRNGG
ncbi:MAG: hypothetical protein Q8S27_21990 [Hoeflea sp.]|uniref:hypothetical protein n=1 Tax=Hoeflea sp. TaxID=1940281 RepID=UPI00272F692F|nr:hypothetical protein [Hoeflea sp.]MDP2120509.1 hypothetical protein [Hoeflea sp.]MDP3527252.1 hypothetical protein [Hoeflea sp.]MDZ7603467.1 hypothetical protein [Hoeflea sp.]